VLTVADTERQDTTMDFMKWSSDNAAASKFSGGRPYGTDEDMFPPYVSHTEWGVVLDDAGSTDTYATYEEAAAAAPEDAWIVRITTTPERRPKQVS
jgi:hypothetical protein